MSDLPNLPWEEIKYDTYRDGIGRDIHVRLTHRPSGIVVDGQHETSRELARHEAAWWMADRLAALAAGSTGDDA